MPQSTTWSTPASASSLRSAATSPTSGRDVRGRVTQDSRLADSSSASGPHSVASFANSLLAKDVRRQRRHLGADRVRGRAGGDDLERLAHFCPSRAWSSWPRTVSLSSSHDFTNLSTPSVSSTSITSS